MRRKIEDEKCFTPVKRETAIRVEKEEIGGKKVNYLFTKTKGTYLEMVWTMTPAMSM